MSDEILWTSFPSLQLSNQLGLIQEHSPLQAETDTEKSVGNLDTTKT